MRITFTNQVDYDFMIRKTVGNVTVKKLPCIIQSRAYNLDIGFGRNHDAFDTAKWDMFSEVSNLNVPYENTYEYGQANLIEFDHENLSITYRG